MLTGCGSAIATAGMGAPNRYQIDAAGYLGCRAGEISITEFVSESHGSASWVATCDERTVVCGGSPGNWVHCSPLRAAVHELNEARTP